MTRTTLNSALLLLATLLLPSLISAQPLSVYTNLQRDIMVWDNGMIRKIDYLNPIKISTGRIAIPYIDNSQNFKIYYRGGSTKINIGFTNDFQVSDNLIAYENASALNVFDQGNSIELTTRMKAYTPVDERPVKYQLGDSLIVYQDGIQSEFRVYYNGTITKLADFLASDALHAIKVSDNIAAYVNYANQFYIFYLGSILPIEEFQIQNFGVGRNIVGYVDINRIFKTFYKGQVKPLESFPPDSYQVGDNLIAYVSNDGYFKIYYDDSVYNIGYFRPDYKVVDNMVTYTDANGYYRVFYKGDVTTLETYTPDNVMMGYNSIAYKNRFGVLRMFSFGELNDVTSSDTDNMQLNYDVLQYRISNNLYRFYYKGKDY